jgi:hypothetical protein
MKLSKLTKTERAKIGVQLQKTNTKLRRLAGKLLLHSDGEPACLLALKALDALQELQSGLK